MGGGGTCSGFVPLPPLPPISLGVDRLILSLPSSLALSPVRPPVVCALAVYSVAKLRWEPAGMVDAWRRTEADARRTERLSMALTTGEENGK